MNTGRRRNVYTLGDSNPINTPFQHFKAQLSRRKVADPFEKDPFKVQSYNFHYADRPIYPVPNLQRQLSSQSNNTQCENFFYNHDFPHDSRSFSNQRFICTNYNYNNKENRGTSGVSTFQESRRRQFVQEQKQSSAYHKTTVGSSAFNNSRGVANSSSAQCNNRYASIYPVRSTSSCFGTKTETKYLNSSSNGLNKSSPRDKSPRLNINNSKSKSPQREMTNKPNTVNRWSSSTTDLYTNKKQMRDSPSMRSLLNKQNTERQNSTNSPRKLNTMNISGTESARFSIESKRSLSSGCEININIKPLAAKSKGENLTIKIETDAVIKNLDIKKPKRSISLIDTNINSSRSPPLQPSAVVPTSPGLTLTKQTSKTFFIDKHISKYSLNNNEGNRQGGGYDLERKRTYDKIQKQQQQQQQQNELNKSYEREKSCRESLAYVYKPPPPPRPYNPRVIPSSERLPSLVPWKSTNKNDWNDSKPSNKSTNTSPKSPRRNLLQRVQSNMKYNNSSIGSDNFNSYSTSTTSERPSCSSNCCNKQESKILNSVANATHNRSFLTKSLANKSSLATICGLNQTKPLFSYAQPLRSNFVKSTPLEKVVATSSRSLLKPLTPLLYSNNSKTPLNLNINVYSDKMQKLCV